MGEDQAMHFHKSKGILILMKEVSAQMDIKVVVSISHHLAILGV